MSGSVKSFNILIVEDSETQAHKLAYLVEKGGYTATIVYSAEEALENIKVSTPSLVISDIMMPGMSGYELCAAIRSVDSTAAIPVILLTSLVSSQDIISALECGADDFISKPYDDDFLAAKLDKFFNKSSEHSESSSGNDTGEVVYSGRHYRIYTGKRKKLDLMISAYEAAIIKNRQLLTTQEELVNTNRELEITVIDKERALEDVKIKEELLKKWNSELYIMNLLGAVINQSVTLDELLQGVAEEILNYEFSGAKYGVEVILASEDNKPSSFYKYIIKNEKTVVLETGELSEGNSDILNHDELINISPRCTLPLCFWKDNSDAENHGHISIMMVARERKVGLIGILTDEGFIPDEHVCEMLISLGKQLGMAVENHNLFSETMRLSLHDPLTGLANRRMIDIMLESQMARANRYGSVFCLIIIDIDHFKQYNDKFGHDEGDRILVALSTCLKQMIRDTDLAARFGGEEFIVIISETGIEESYRIAEKYLKVILEKTGITVSIGVAEYKSNQTAKDLIKAADEAMYRAKEKGRNQVERAG